MRRIKVDTSIPRLLEYPLISWKLWKIAEPIIFKLCEEIWSKMSTKVLFTSSLILLRKRIHNTCKSKERTPTMPLRICRGKLFKKADTNLRIARTAGTFWINSPTYRACITCKNRTQKERASTAIQIKGALIVLMQ